VNSNFDPNGVGIKGALFGIVCQPDLAGVVLIPVPWDVTASYGKGAVTGPRAILDASHQLDLSLPEVHRPWLLGMAMDDISSEWELRSEDLSAKIAPYLQDLARGGGSQYRSTLEEVNQAGEELNRTIKKLAADWLLQGKIVGVVGGDHSVPLGLVDALGETHQAFGILQIDAHADLREAYQGFRNSHASIMYNLLEMPQVAKLVQVGVRDFCQEEAMRVEQDKRIVTYFDSGVKSRLMRGGSWDRICGEIARDLPQEVYISFDIDGLDPALCPATGTPVPGGLSFDQADYLLRYLISCGKKIIGFDLCEVTQGNNQWDGNVGARVLYRLGIYAGASQGLVQTDLKGKSQ